MTIKTTFTPATPDSYLSTGEGIWTVIHQHLPLMADTTDATRALSVARKAKIQLHTMWNGDVGAFVPFTMGSI